MRAVQDTPDRPAPESSPRPAHDRPTTTTTVDQLAVVGRTGSTVTFFNATGHELLDVLDSRTHARLGRIPAMAPGPHWLVVTPDGLRGYTTNKEAPFASALDLDRGVCSGRIPVPGSEGLALMPDGRQLIVATPRPTSPPGTRPNLPNQPSTSSTPSPARPPHSADQGPRLATLGPEHTGISGGTRPGLYRGRTELR